MKNIKIEKNLIGQTWWKGVAAVAVSGIPEETSYSLDLSDEEREKIIQTWKTIAVLEVKTSRPFQVGFISGNEIWILKYPIETLNGKFGMRIGKGDVKFFVFDPNFQELIQLSLVEVVKENDGRYADLPVY